MRGAGSVAIVGLDDSHNDWVDDSVTGDDESPTTDDVDIERLEAERRALEMARKQERDASAIRQGRRIGGTAGAAMASAMLALRDIYEGKVTADDPPEIREHPGEPHDVDRDGVSMSVGDVDVSTPALPRTAPIIAEGGRRRFRRRRR